MNAWLRKSRASGISQTMMTLARGLAAIAAGTLTLLVVAYGCGLEPIQRDAPISLLAASLPGPRRPGHGPNVAGTPPGAPLFRNVLHESRIGYRWEILGKRPLNILQTIGNGCAFLDYDSDGNLDILLVGSRIALYAGDGKGRFTDVSVEAGLAGLTGHFLGCAVGDVDGDGNPD